MKATTLAARLNRLIAQIDRQIAPKQWFFLLEADRALPEHVRAQFGPGDTVVIRQYPVGLLGDDDPDGYKLCWVQ